MTLETANLRKRRVPYPGIDPFTFEQRDLFFGRDVEGRIVSAMIAAEPLSILTGASGTGKSSLIRAMLVPTLASRAWTVIYAQPGANPVEEITQEMIAQAIPDPRQEIGIIQRLLDLATSLTRESRLSDAVAWYSSLDHGDPRRIDISATTGIKIPRIPVLAMVLAGIVPVQWAGACFCELAGAPASYRDPSLGEICAMEYDLVHGRRDLVAAISSDSPSIAELAARLWRNWLLPNASRGLVIILDQAEELYTVLEFSRSYVGREVPLGAPDARYADLHDGLFKSIGEFVAMAGALPLHLCVSLRPEWYTDLRVSLGASMPDEARALHVLRPMSREQALGAIKHPAEYVGATVDGRAATAIVDALEAETHRQAADPFLLGLICRLAWDLAAAPAEDPVRIECAHIGKIAAGPEPDLVQSAAAVVPRAATIPPLVTGALLWLFHREFHKMEEAEQFDALDLLEGLFTTRGTRRIVAQRELIERPLRSRASLLKTLEKLELAQLVRRVYRDMESFVEIRHDRLIDPLLVYKHRLDRLEQSGKLTAGRYRSLLNRALEVLVHFDGKRLSQAMADGFDEDVLPAWVRETLRSNRDAVDWDSAAARAMLASLIFSGPERASTGAKLDEYRQSLRDLFARASVPLYHAGGAEALDRAREQLPRGAHVAPEDLQSSLLSKLSAWSIEARVMFLDALIRLAGTSEHRAPERERLRVWMKACLGQRAPL